MRLVLYGLLFAAAFFVFGSVSAQTNADRECHHEKRQSEKFGEEGAI